MSNDILEQELRDISTKINALNPGNEVLFALLSAFLIVVTSYREGLVDTLNLWGISFGTVFALWEIQSFLRYYKTIKSNPKQSVAFVEQQKPLTIYRGEIVGKTTYSGIQAFGILSITSLCIYLVLYITDKIKNHLWSLSLLIFLLILALMVFMSEQRIITLFGEFRGMVSTSENFTVQYNISTNELIKYALGFLAVIFIILRSFWAMGELLIEIYLKHSSVPLLLVFFQYILVWALMSAINKNQVRRDLTNALICLQNLQYNSESDKISVDQVASCVKYTHFLKLTPLKILEFYFYLPHPLYEQILKKQDKKQES